MATPANTTTRPAILPQSVIENCRRNANELCERLAALDPNRTDVVLRKAWNKSTNLNKPRYLFDPEKINNAQAVLAHLAGRVVKEDECISCAHGHGPFTECVRILMRETDRDDFIFMGACTNCRIGGEQSYCSLARKSERPGLSMSLLFAMLTSDVRKSQTRIRYQQRPSKIIDMYRSLSWKR